MAISLKSLKRTTAVSAPLLLIYGTEKIGKTSFASQAPNAVFLQTEQGEGMLDIATFGLLKSYGEVMEALASLDSDEHEFKTIVVDSLDWLSPLIDRHTCEVNKWPNIDAPGYGQGYTATLTYWREFLDALKFLRDERGMAVVLIAHYEIKTFKSPETEPYDRFQPKLQKNACGVVLEWAEGIFFANYRASTTKTEVAPKQTVTRGVGGGERLVYTEERPAYKAGNRWAMPPTLPLDWHAVAAHIPFYNTQQPAQAGE